jgi:gliding motility-associated-like protein
MPLIKKFSALLLLSACILLVSFSSFGTHLKGGEITVKRISDKTLTFEFTLTTYTEDNPANRDQIDVSFCFGDGSDIVRAARCCGTPVPIGNGTMKNIYKVQYTYPAAALSYKVSVAIPNRNENVRNIDRSVNVAFYVETTFSINSGLGQNSTPFLLNPAVDLTAVVGQPFIHNPNAVDAEGDSLAYRLSVSKTGDAQSCAGLGRGEMAAGFVQPNLAISNSSLVSSFTINSTNGDLIWDSPQEIGKYNCAFIVEEWRNGIKISETVRDMQIEVKDLDNKGPKLTIPSDVCIQAGTNVTATITAIDLASKTGRLDPLTITSTGNVYQIDTVYAIKPAFANFVSRPAQLSPASASFSWQTSCVHIRKEPYDVFFKVTDLPPTQFIDKLIDSKIWKIKVIAPAIKNLRSSITLAKNSISLKWDPYTCSLPNAKIVIYRKQGPCVQIENKSCETGMTQFGFKEVGRVDVNVNQFEDVNDNLPFSKNTNYVYVALVEFLNSKGVGDVSPLSNASCIFIPTSSPLMTNVSVQKTASTGGEILVRWTRPIKLDTNLYPGPYRYRVLRAEGVVSEDFVQVGDFIPAKISPARNDTSFVDKTANTTSKIYRYKVDFYYTQNNAFRLLDTPNPASTVYLIGQAKDNGIALSWLSDVPWSNDFQIHRVYREYPLGSGKFNQIADVSVAGQSTYIYKDDGKDNFSLDGKFDYSIKKDTNYCYYVETLGSYGEGFPVMKLVNASSILCYKLLSNSGGNNGSGGSGTGGGTDGGGVTPVLLNPCAPKLSLSPPDCDALNNSLNCDFSIYTNNLSWTPTVSGDCDPNLVSYKLYYAKSNAGPFTVVAQVAELKKAHAKADGFRGCYYVTAINKEGKESPKSEILCVENCPFFELPNIFSPNGDNKNDVWQPIRCPRFVTTVTCKIVDRYGQLIYDYTGDLKGFGWNGKDKNGNEMSASTYFYTCDVVFDVIDPANQTKSIKSWVELVR